MAASTGPCQATATPRSPFASPGRPRRGALESSLYADQSSFWSDDGAGTALETSDGEIEGQRAGQEVDAQAVKRKVDRAILPLFFSVAVLCYLDRSNLNYASIPLSQKLGFTDFTYGMGAGVFCLGYALFQVPSNLVLAKVGARRWLFVLMLVWGVTASSMAAVQSLCLFLVVCLWQSASAFHLLRFMLGIAESGTFPGMWFHMSRFYTPEGLGPAYATVSTATALSSVFGGFIAAGLLCMDGVAGLDGWQWLFLMEGLPTIGLAFVVRFCLTDSPSRSTFLRPAEKQWLQDQLQTSTAAIPSAGSRKLHIMRPFGIGKAFGGICGWRVWYIGLVWGLIECSLYGVLFWSNKLMLSFLELPEGGPGGCLGSSTVKVTLLSVVPFGSAALATILVAQRSQRRQERRWHTAGPLFLASMAMLMMPALEGFLGGALSFCAMTLAASGVWAVHGPLLSWPATFLKGSDAAGGYALVNSMGSIGGFVGPVVIGMVGDSSGSYDEAIYILAAGLLLAALLVIVFPDPGAILRTTAEAPGEENNVIRSAELARFLEPSHSPSNQSRATPARL